MSILIGLLYVLEVVVCLLLAGVILLQKPKDGGLNAAIAGGMGESFFGAQVGSVLVKTTIVLGVIFLLNTMLLSRLTSYANEGSVMQGVRTAPVETQAPLPFSGPAGMPEQ